MIDNYCERVGPDLWAEPVNAITNIAFFISFLLLLPRCKAVWPTIAWGNRSVVCLLMALLVAICLGSTAFHTLANRWSLMADVIPISLFQLVFLIGYLAFIARTRWFVAVPIVIAFLVAGSLLGRLPVAMNGSQSYLAPLIFVAGLGVYHLRHRLAFAWGLLLAAGVFVVSLSFRTIDNSLCGVWPLGTHFLWHVLNAVVLYLCLRVYIETVASDPVK